jgi:TP901 family phage tail tape measure protein
MAANASARYVITAENKTQKAFKSIKKSLKSVGGSAAALGKNISTKMLAPMGAFAGFSLKTAGDFESAMNKVSAISGSTGETLKALENQAKELGRTTQFSASEAADAMGFLSMAGFDAQKTMAAMPGILDLAAASSTDLATTADIASNILSGLGMEASKTGQLADVMAKATASANLNVLELGEAMKMAAPMADAANLSLEGMTAIMGKMADAGIKGTMAGTAVKAGITKLLNPTKQVSAALDGMGVSVSNSDGSMRNFIDILTDLEKAGAGAAEFTKIFGERAGPALLASTKQGVGAIKELKAKLQDAGGTAKTMADTQMKGLNGSIKKLKSAFEGLQLAVANSGLLEWATKMTDKLTAFMAKISGTGGAMSGLGSDIAAFAAVIQEKLAVAWKIITDIFGGFSQYLEPIKQAWGELGTAWDDLMASIFGAESAGQAESMKAFWTAIGQLLGVTIKLAVTAVTLAFKGLGVAIEGVKAIWNGLSELANRVMTGVKDALMKPIIQLMKGIKKVAEKLPDFIGDPAEKAIDRMLTAFKKGEDEAVGHSIIPDMVDAIGDHMNRLPSLMADPAKAAADATLDTFDKLGKGIEGGMVGVIRGTQSMKNVFKSTLNSMIDDALRAQVIKPILNSIFGGLGGLFGGGVSTSALQAAGMNVSPTASFAGGGYTGDGSRSGGIDGKGGFRAILHPKETVIDHTKTKAQLNTATGEVRQVSAEINFNVQAIDASSFNNYLVGNRATIESIINNSLTTNGSVRRTIRQVV